MSKRGFDDIEDVSSSDDEAAKMPPPAPPSKAAKTALQEQPQGTALPVAATLSSAAASVVGGAFASRASASTAFGAVSSAPAIGAAASRQPFVAGGAPSFSQSASFAAQTTAPFGTTSSGAGAAFSSGLPHAASGIAVAQVHPNVTSTVSAGSSSFGNLPPSTATATSFSNAAPPPHLPQEPLRSMQPGGTTASSAANQIPPILEPRRGGPHQSDPPTSSMPPIVHAEERTESSTRIALAAAASGGQADVGGGYVNANAWRSGGEYMRMKSERMKAQFLAFHSDRMGLVPGVEEERELDRERRERLQERLESRGFSAGEGHGVQESVGSLQLVQQTGRAGAGAASSASSSASALVYDAAGRRIAAGDADPSSYTSTIYDSRRTYHQVRTERMKQQLAQDAQGAQVLTRTPAASATTAAANGNKEGKKTELDLEMDPDPLAAIVRRLATAEQRQPNRQGPMKLFSGLTFWMTGRTTKFTDMQIKKMILQHGGVYEPYGFTKVSHIIAENLAMGNQAWREYRDKRQKKRYKVVVPAWLEDCVRAGRLLPEEEYLPEVLRQVKIPTAAEKLAMLEKERTGLGKKKDGEKMKTLAELAAGKSKAAGQKSDTAGGLRGELASTGRLAKNGGKRARVEEGTTLNGEGVKESTQSEEGEPQLSSAERMWLGMLDEAPVRIATMGGFPGGEADRRALLRDFDGHVQRADVVDSTGRLFSVPIKGRGALIQALEKFPDAARVHLALRDSYQTQKSGTEPLVGKAARAPPPPPKSATGAPVPHSAVHITAQGLTAANVGSGAASSSSSVLKNGSSKPEPCASCAKTDSAGRRDLAVADEAAVKGAKAEVAESFWESNRRLTVLESAPDGRQRLRWEKSNPFVQRLLNQPAAQTTNEVVAQMLALAARADSNASKTEVAPAQAGGKLGKEKPTTSSRILIIETVSPAEKRKRVR